MTFTYVNSVCGQSSYDQFTQEENIHEKGRMTYDLYHYYIRYNLDSIKIVAMELLLDDDCVENSFAQNMAYRALGAYLIRTGSVSKGLSLLKSAADYFEKNSDFLMASEIYNDIGHGLTIDYELDEAMRAYETSIELGKHDSDPTSEFNALLGLGKAELIEGDTVSALENLMTYRIHSLKLKKHEAASDATSIIANVYFEQGDQAKGLALMKEAVDLSLRSESEIHHSHAYTNLAIYFFENEEIDSSKYYFQKSLDLRLNLGNIKAIIEAYYNMGDFYWYTNKPDSAEEYYKKSFLLAESNNFLPDEIDASSALVKCFDSNGEEYLMWQNKTDSLRRVAQSKSGFSDSIINYALSLSDTGEQLKQDQESSWSNFYFILIGLIVTGVVFVILKTTS